MMRQLHMRKSLQVALGFLVIMGIIAFFFAEPISRRNLTRTRVVALEYRIFLFINGRHRLPANLAELPARKGYDNSILDAWGNPIIYSYDSNGIVRLESLESEKHTDEKGNHEKIELRFATKDSNGDWRKEP